jgi:hypothetical protein
VQEDRRLGDAEEWGRPPNKELKLTKPSIMELRSLTPVFDGRGGEAAPSVATAGVA